MESRTIGILLDVVKGKVVPDLVIRNGRIVNVFTNTIDENFVIAVKDGFVASVEKEGKDRYCKAPVLDAEGLYVCPGFIDGHTHLDSMHTFSEFVPYALRGGVTTVVTETSAAACACGVDGVMGLVESTKGYPLQCLFVAPPLTPPFPDMEGSQGVTLREFGRLLQREDFVGIGEAYWTRIVEGDERVLKQAAMAMNLGKALDGHAAGARGTRLIEYVLTGITSCHESTTMDEAMEKLRLGLHIMIREGWVRRELDELSRLKDTGVDVRRLILVSDVFDAIMLMEEGYLDSIVRKAIRLGFSPMEAIKMATINPADYYGLRHLGAIAPLRRADMLFLSDLCQVAIEKVMAGGEVVISKGAPTMTCAPGSYPEAMKRTIGAGKFTEEDFEVRTTRKEPVVRVIELANQTITREIHQGMAVKDGCLQRDLERDIIPVAVINRNKRGSMGKGFLKGSGINRGAVATTLIWDTGNILVLGSNEADMKAAVNRLIDLQGGTVIAREGSIIFEFPMAIFGIMSPVPMEEFAGKTKDLVMGMKAIGSVLERPSLTIQTIPFTGLPFLRITDKGLADIKNRKLVPLIL